MMTFYFSRVTDLTYAKSAPEVYVGAVVCSVVVFCSVVWKGLYVRVVVCSVVAFCSVVWKGLYVPVVVCSVVVDHVVIPVNIFWHASVTSSVLVLCCAT